MHYNYFISGKKGSARTQCEVLKTMAILIAQSIDKIDRFNKRQTKFDQQIGTKI